MRVKHALWATLMLSSSLAGCTTASQPPQLTPVSSAKPKQWYTWGPGSPLLAADGRQVGEVRLTTQNGVPAIGLVANGLTPVSVTLEIRSAGNCAGSSFGASGAPLPLVPPLVGSFQVPASEPLTVTTNVYGAKLRTSDPGSKPALLDQDGSSVLILEQSRSGVPIACGAIRDVE